LSEFCIDEYFKQLTGGNRIVNVFDEGIIALEAILHDRSFNVIA
jgi:hypothetical protein